VRILLVEDSARLRRYIRDALLQAGYAVDLASDGEEGLWLAESNDYDAIVLDLMLPKVDGMTVLRTLREKGRLEHVLILTAKDTVDDRVRGLVEGADDYLIKPFALEELLARIQALVRRTYGLKTSSIAVADLAVDTAKRTVSRNGIRLDLTPREYSLLEYLAMNQGQVVSRTEIEHHIYDERIEPMSNVVDSSVCRLRKKIDSPGKHSLVRTRRGMGYVLGEQNR